MIVNKKSLMGLNSQNFRFKKKKRKKPQKKPKYTSMLFGLIGVAPPKTKKTKSPFLAHDQWLTIPKSLIID